MKNEISIFGCGWLGEPLAYSLNQKGFSIKGSTTSETKMTLLNSKGISTYLIQLEKLTPAIDAFLTSEILVVNIPSKNVEGFKNLISYIEKSTIQKIIFISSTSVYANSEEIITEKTPVIRCDLVEIELDFENWVYSNYLVDTDVECFADSQLVVD